MAAAATGIVLIDEPSRALGRRDVATALALPVVAVVPFDPAIARAVDAAAVVVGTRAPGPGARLREVVEGSLAVQLSHHQHRPVLVVPLSVVDWTTPLWR